MPLWSAFCGGSYTDRSLSIAADQAVNVFTQTRQIPGSPKTSTLYGTPGQKFLTTLDTIGSRGWFSQDGRTFVVIGGTLYEQMSATSYTVIGAIPNDGKMCAFTSNGEAGDQLGIVGGGQINVYNLVTGTFVTAILPFLNPVSLVFLDGYAITNQLNSPILWFSALEDMTAWDALDFIARADTSDNVIALGVSQDRIWVFGSHNTNQFYDSGDADTPFVPYQGTTSQNGLVSPQLLSVYRNTFLWVSSASDGNYRVVSGTTTSPTPVSTHQIETWLAGATTLTDAWMDTYEQDGHIFFLITAPSSPDAIKTYAYDATEQTYPWHARANWDEVNGVYTLWRVRGTVNVNGIVYAGDYATGDLYQLDLNTYADNGHILRRSRRAPYLGAENQWAFIDQFELGTEPGVGLITGQGTDPVATLRISYDGAKTFYDAGDAKIGMSGDTDARTIWVQLGRARMDRLVFEVSMTDPVKCVWGPGAWLRTSPGSGQL